MVDGHAGCERIGLQHHSWGGSRIRGWKSRPVTLGDLAHIIHMTLRLYGCPWEAIRIGFQMQPHKLGERDVNGELPLQIACALAPYLLKIENENNAPNVIESLLSLHGDTTTVPNRNRKLLLGTLMASGEI